ncbi:MAG TPA: dihydrofolate reductase family protein [Actinomycetes bacterium]|nr:dihydrofolate reductase family protein [Actinomycetes bacterium]
MAGAGRRQQPGLAGAAPGGRRDGAGAQDVCGTGRGLAAADRPPDHGRDGGPDQQHAKYVASRSLSAPLEWNAILLEGDLAESVAAIKERHGLLLVSGAGELTHALTALGLVDEFWFWVSPALWPAGPRIFDGVGPVRLELIGATTFGSGVLRLAYRPAPER